MTMNERKVIRAKIEPRELAKQLGNVSQARKVLRYSRDSFYKRLRRDLRVHAQPTPVPQPHFDVPRPAPPLRRELRHRPRHERQQHWQERLANRDPAVFRGLTAMGENLAA